VCSIQAGDRREAETLRLYVSRPEDITLLKAPPWWSLQDTAILAGTIVVAGLLAWGWTAALRRQVRRQTEVIRRNEQDLISISRRAGMAEVATSVLHNVGNVLNSVNVSLHVAAEAVRKSKISGVARLATLMKEQEPHLAEFVKNDPRGQSLPAYLSKLAEVLGREQALVLDELKSLTSNVEHINDIVAMQQTYAKAGGVTETVNLAELLEDALRMSASALERHEIRVKRKFDPAAAPIVPLERNKALQILLNLISNAKYACSASGRPEKQLTLALSNGGGSAKIVCSDNGIGIPKENLTRIFNHGFTTRPGGHGFGLHGSALAATEMGGRLSAQSDGPGHGASFTLELPASRKDA
jgi:signal transduction histidine kinase